MEARFRKHRRTTARLSSGCMFLARLLLSAVHILVDGEHGRLDRFELFILFLSVAHWASGVPSEPYLWP